MNIKAQRKSSTYESQIYQRVTFADANSKLAQVITRERICLKASKDSLQEDIKRHVPVAKTKVNLMH